MNLWPVEHFFPPFFFQISAKSVLIWKKTGEKSVQLVRGSFFRKYFLWNPYSSRSSEFLSHCQTGVHFCARKFLAYNWNGFYIVLERGRQLFYFFCMIDLFCEKRPASNGILQFDIADDLPLLTWHSIDTIWWSGRKKWVPLSRAPAAARRRPSAACRPPGVPPLILTCLSSPGTKHIIYLTHTHEKHS